MKKRMFLQAGTAILTSIWLANYTGRGSQRRALGQTLGKVPLSKVPVRKTFEIARTEGEWRKILTPQQFHVLRQHGTEVPGSSPLNKEHGRGNYACAACNLPLFNSKTKFDSGTGWPSFYAALPNAVGTSTDKSYFMTRVEVHCRRCGGHLGHVFDDGPPPTGLRYCMNGIALKFLPV
jgi:peptide-methionine (R)-S-oxide reductase